MRLFWFSYYWNICPPTLPKGETGWLLIIFPCLSYFQMAVSSHWKLKQRKIGFWSQTSLRLPPGRESADCRGLLLLFLFVLSCLLYIKTLYLVAKLNQPIIPLLGEPVPYLFREVRGGLFVVCPETALQKSKHHSGFTVCFWSKTSLRLPPGRESTDCRGLLRLFLFELSCLFYLKTLYLLEKLN